MPEPECPCCGQDMETDDWSDNHYCGECGQNHPYPGDHDDDNREGQPEFNGAFGVIE